MSTRPPSSQPPQRPLTKRQLSEMQRESNAQRRLVFALAGAIGLALLLIVGGLVYDRLFVPSRTVRSVNGQSLSRAEYDRIARLTTLQGMIRNLGFSKIVGPNQSIDQSGGTIKSQIVDANSQLSTLGTLQAQKSPVNDAEVTTWTDQTLVAVKAKQDFGIDPQPGEVDQAIIAQYGSLLTPPTPAVTPTATLSDTATASTAGPAASAAAAAGTTAVAGATSGATASAATATITPSPTMSGPTATPSPSPTPSASPVPQEATSKVNQLVDVLYTEYENILTTLPVGTPAESKRLNATKNDFVQALRDQFRSELITQKVKEKLPLDETSQPDQIKARHILLKVPKPSATPSPTTAAGATPTTQATGGITPTATITPVPTPTFTPDALEKAFQDRLPEAEAIYKEVLAKPETFADVAKAKSEDEGSAAQGGELPAFPKEGQMEKPFADAAFALKDNEISKPVRTQYGWHIIQRLPEDPTAKKERLQTAAFTKWQDALRASATIVPAPTATPTTPPTPVPPSEVPSAGAASAVPETTALPATTAEPQTTATK